LMFRQIYKYGPIVVPYCILLIPYLLDKANRIGGPSERNIRIASWVVFVTLGWMYIAIREQGRELDLLRGRKK